MEVIAFLEEIMPVTWWAISILGLVVLCLMIAIFNLNRKLKRFQASYITLQTFMSGKKLDDLLDGFINNLEQQNSSLQESKRRIDIIETKVRAAVDRANLVKFNAFNNVGGELSFALALLNQQGDGVVLSAIHSREESRVYAKSVTKGSSQQLLSKEEIEAIAGAMNTSKV